MNTRFKLGDAVVQVDLLAKSPLEVQLTLNDAHENYSFNCALSRSEGRIVMGERSVPYFVTAAKGGVWVTLAGHTWFFEKAKKRAGADQGHGGFGAPMPGKITRIQVSVGQTVEKGQVLVIMEAMKMEHRIEAPGPGTITALHCCPDQLVDQDFQLLDFAPEVKAEN